MRSSATGVLLVHFSGSVLICVAVIQSISSSASDDEDENHLIPPLHLSTHRESDLNYHFLFGQQDWPSINLSVL